MYLLLFTSLSPDQVKDLRVSKPTDCLTNRQIFAGCGNKSVRRDRRCQQLLLKDNDLLG